MKRSFITQTVKYLNCEDFKGVCVEILPDVIDLVNTVVYKNLDGDFTLIFEIEITAVAFRIISLLNYSCIVTDYDSSNESVLKIEDEIYKMINDFAKSNNTSKVDILSLHINMKEMTVEIV